MTVDLIISAATGYAPEQVRTFTLSALQNTRADIMFIIQDTDRGLMEWCRLSPRIRFHPMKAEKDPRAIVVLRFFSLQAIIESTGADHVLLSDARDVFFQSDPFALFKTHQQAHDPGLIFAQEPLKIGRCAINSRWISNFFGDQALQSCRDKPVLCAGTILGRSTAMQTFLASLCQLMNEKMGSIQGKYWGLDQAALNHLIHNLQDQPPHSCRDNSQGPFLTLHSESTFQLNSQGLLQTPAGEVLPIVHQYDRFPWLARHLCSQLMAGPSP